MQTLTIRVDENYLEQILNFLQQIPKNKREIFQHTKIDISPTLVQSKTDKWKRIDAELRNLKTVDVNAGEELKSALALIGKGVEVGDYKTARDEYLTNKYGL